MFNYLCLIGVVVCDWVGLLLVEFDDVCYCVVFMLELDVVEYLDGCVSVVFLYVDELFVCDFVEVFVELYYDEVVCFVGVLEVVFGVFDVCVVV